MERGFYHPQLGYWQTIADVPQRILNSYPAGTVQVPLKPSSGSHEWIDGAWKPIAPPVPTPEQRIAELKQFLRDTDYVALSDYDKDKSEIVAQRQAARNELRELGA
jgi:hypothetical protein